MACASAFGRRFSSRGLIPAAELLVNALLPDMIDVSWPAHRCLPSNRSEGAF